MRRALIHIGSSKTGSTAIQHSLAHAKPEESGFGCLQTRAGSLPHRVHEFIKIEGLRKILERLAFARTNSGVEGVLRRQYDDRHVGRALAHSGQAGKAIAIFKNDIGKHHAEPALFQLPVTCGNAGAVDNGKAFILQCGNDDGRNGDIVFDKQDRSGCWHGFVSPAPAADAGGNW